ncbi:unnamed protein product [Eruca vesicaria subsp. sativa]|uniref:Uncharacterized protein n=1 Tax=Eruca vesicaria subsp. sativa TaxID=29727 RepID=A0ABC8LEI2_ERUVS|nr:unnamed protein product [Eruca vesicaria subsp. sativa]
MLAKKKKKPCPYVVLSFKSFRLARKSNKRRGMDKKRKKSISLADFGEAAIGSSIPSTSSPATACPMKSGSTLACSSGSAGSPLQSKEASPSSLLFASPPAKEAVCLTSGSGSALVGSKATGDGVTPERNYADLLCSIARNGDPNWLSQSGRFSRSYKRQETE